MQVLRTSWKFFRIGGWAPALVLAAHLFLSRIVHAYTIWPPVDMPVHFSGGVAIAFLVSRLFQLLPRDGARRSRVVLLELVLIVSLTASAAVFWEFVEFTGDQLFGTNVQVGLNNTMRDMAMGISGATVFAMLRARQLGAWVQDVSELAGDWARGAAD